MIINLEVVLAAIREVNNSIGRSWSGYVDKLKKNTCFSKMILKTPSISYTLLVVCSVNLLATAGDITQTWTSPTFPKLNSTDPSINPIGRPITSDENSWIGSLLNIGSMIGTLPFGFIAEKFGRKPALLCIGIPHIISYLSMAFATNVYLFYVGRFIGGIAVGGGYTILPMYIAEISDDKHRGIYSVTLGIFWSIGNFLPYAVGPFLSIKIFNIVAASFPILFTLLFLLLGTETPHFLVAQKQTEKAENVLMLLRGATKKDIQNELTGIEQMLAKEEHGSLMDILTDSGLRKCLIISVVFMLFQQSIGFGSSVGYYLQPILDASGTKMSSDIGSVMMGVALVISSLIPPLIIERFRRKRLAIFSTMATGVSLTALGVFFYLKDFTSFDVGVLFWLPITSLILGIFSFQSGLSVIPWTVSAELFPKSVKQISATMVSLACWVGQFVATKYFNDMNDLFKSAGIFWFFALMTCIFSLFIWIFVPETKGKTLDEIQAMIRRRVSFVSVKDNEVAPADNNTEGVA